MGEIATVSMAYKLTSQLRTSRMKAEATKRRLDSEDASFRMGSNFAMSNILSKPTAPPPPRRGGIALMLASRDTAVAASSAHHPTMVTGGPTPAETLRGRPNQPPHPVPDRKASTSAMDFDAIYTTIQEDHAGAGVEVTGASAISRSQLGQIEAQRVRDVLRAVSSRQHNVRSNNGGIKGFHSTVNKADWLRRLNRCYVKNLNTL